MATLTIRWKHYDPEAVPCPQAKERLVERSGTFWCKRWQSLLVLEGDFPSSEQFMWLLHQLPKIEWALFQTPHSSFARLRPFQLMMKGLS